MVHGDVADKNWRRGRFLTRGLPSSICLERFQRRPPSRCLPCQGISVPPVSNSGVFFRIAGRGMYRKEWKMLLQIFYCRFLHRRVG